MAVVRRPVADGPGGAPEPEHSRSHESLDDRHRALEEAFFAKQDAVLRGAGEAGLKAGASGYVMLGKWLETAPPAALAGSWKGYVGAITAGMDHASRRALQAPIMNRARAVALAAGGFLGIGMRVSDVEEKVLGDLAGAFSV